jgi:hypothetical protein
MIDPQAQQIGIGGALFLAALGMLLKYKPWERKNGNNGKRQQSAGEQSSDYWKIEIRNAVKEAVEQEFRGRAEPLKQEDLRRIVREELVRFDPRRYRG